MSSEDDIENDNDLSACNRLKQLRNLQNQLAMMITDARREPVDGDDGPGLDDSARSTTSLTSAVSNTEASNRSIGTSTRSALTLPADIETGMWSGLKPSTVKTSIETLLSMEDVQPLVKSENYVQGLESMPSIPNSKDVNISSQDESQAPPENVAEGTNSVDPSLQHDRGRRSRSSSFSRPFGRRRSRSRGSTSSRGSKSGPLMFRRSKEKEPFLDEKPISGHLPTYDFLSKQDEEKEERSLFPGAKWWHGVFIFSIVSALACVTTLWAPYPIGARMPTEMVAEMPFSNGCQDGLQTCICPRETICADDLVSMIFLTISRTSAWFDYPLYMLLFLSKANNLNNYLQKTVLRCWVNFSDYHKVHSLFGVVVAIESASHSFFHILRWARRYDDIQFLWNHPTGITGLIALVLCPFIVLPMIVPFLKKRMTFEWRKGLHYLCVLWGAALMKHAPQRIFWLIGVPIFVYVTDKLVEVFFKTHLIESAHFQRLGDTSCIISFENPPGFGKQNSAYVYLMLPWLSKYQFHAFTVFPCCKPNHSSICISKCGNWTESLMKQVVTPTHKPAFVVGPFLSPFSSPAMDSENLVAVASGIGVTPAISLIKQYASTSRRLNLVWICRDAGLVEHFVTNVEFSGYGHILIYYTGGNKRSIVLGNDLPPNVFIFNGRPNLERTISGIIHSISSGDGLPEELHKTHRVISKAPAELRSKLLIEKALDIYTVDQLFDFTVKASFQSYEGLDPLMPVVNYSGVLSTMKHLLGDDCELVTEKITTNFEKVNVDSSCQLNRVDFENFMKLMLEEDDAAEMSSIASVKLGLKKMSTCKNLFDSQKKCHGFVPNKDEFGIRNILQGEGKFAAKNWNMLYCGGSEAVLAQLKAYKRKYSIGLSVEKFDW